MEITMRKLRNQPLRARAAAACALAGAFLAASVSAADTNAPQAGAEAIPVVTIFGNPNLEESAGLDSTLQRIYRECLDQQDDPIGKVIALMDEDSVLSGSAEGAGARSRLADLAQRAPVVSDRGLTRDDSGSNTRGELVSTYSELSPTVDGSALSRMRGAGTAAQDCLAQAPFAYGLAYIRTNDTRLKKARAAYMEKRYEDAIVLFKEAYNKIGYDAAALMLGNMLLAGQGTPRDPAQAAQWYLRVARTSTAERIRVRFKDTDPMAAPPGVQVRVRLANMYAAGNGVAKDPAEARHWYQRAGENNYLPAVHTYGWMLERGYGGKADIGEAVAQYTRAGEQGYGPAQFRLGQMYASGSGVKADLATSFAWFRLAAVNPAAGKTRALAQVALASMYDRGEGVQADQARARSFYREAAKAGVPEALNALATYFYRGEGVPVDLKLSRALFVAAASRGDADAMVNAAAMLNLGEGGARDVQQAYAWLLLAERSGNSDAHKPRAGLAAALTPEQRAQAEAAVASVNKL
jgi:TPR repeat protein